MSQLSDPIRFSHLKNLNKSPAHYRASVLEPREPSTAMRFGKTVHAVLLQRDGYMIFHGDRRGKKWDEFIAANSDRLIITASEYERALWCADSIGANADATRLLVGQHEAERAYTMLGRKCVAHLDVLGAGFVTELKTASSVHPETFRRAALRMGYHAQVASYLDATGQPDGAGFIVAVETAPPWDVVVFELTRRCLDAGRRLFRLWMERLLICESADQWPGYAQSVVPLDIDDETEPLIIDGEEVEAA